MKNRLLFFLSAVFISVKMLSQAPPSINYQGVLRDGAGVPISTLSTIGVQFQITDGASNVVHSETQASVPVNTLGLFSTRIGLSPAISNTVTWQNGPYNLLVSINLGAGFTPFGSQQLVSVPYALFAQNAPTPTLQLSGNNLSLIGGNTVALPGGGGNYSGGMGISLSGSVIINTAPDQTVVLSNGSNINVSGTYPTFTISSNPTLNVQGNMLDISGGNTVVLPTGVTTSVTSGNSNITVAGAAPNYTISSTPSLALNGNSLSISNGNSVILPVPPPPTSITGVGAASVTGVAPSFTVNVPLVTMSGAGSSTVFGAYPNFTISSSTPVSPSITGAGIAVVTPTTGNNFTVSVATPSLTGAFGTTVSGVYPSFTVASPLPVSPTITGVGNSTVTGSYPNWTVSSNPAWLLLGNAGTNPATNFIGTTDNNPLSFRANNIRAGKLDPAGQTFYGYQSGISTTAASVTGVGFQALFSNTTGNNNTAFGYKTLFSNTGGSGNTAVGDNALQANSSGINNTGFGSSALFSNTTGNSNTSGGAGALYSNINGSSNMAYGGSALYSNTSGSNNNAFGGFALYTNATGSNNIAIGASAGYNNTGSGNVFIGNQAGYNANSSNQLWIANSNVGVPLVFGDFSTGNLGLGTTTPAEKLQVETGGTTRLSVISTNTSAIWFGLTAFHNKGFIQYDNSSNEMNFGTNNTPSVLRLFGNGTAAYGSTLAANPIGSHFNFCKQGANDTKVSITGGDNTNTWGALLAMCENESGTQGFGFKMDAGANKLYITNDVNGTSNVMGIGGYSGQNVGVSIGPAFAPQQSPINGLAVQGSVGVGTVNPITAVHVSGNITQQDGQQGTGRVLVSDAVGTATWKSSPNAAIYGGLNNTSFNISTTPTAVGPAMSYSKFYGNTHMDIELHTRSYHGTFGGGGAYIYYQIRVDGNPITSSTFVSSVNNGTEYISIKAYVSALPAGSHTVQVYANMDAGTSTGLVLDPGGFNGTVIVKEEF